MTETERVLQVLIHDARTPIGVALGYLRLLQERRLATDEDRDRAIARSIDAMGRLTRLCDQASGFVGGSGDKREQVAVSAADLVARVEDGVRPRRFLVDGDGMDVDHLARVRIAVSPDRLADAITEVLASLPVKSQDVQPTLRVKTTPSELRFTAVTDDHSATPDANRTFDPWRAGGLSVPLACHVIAQSAGRIEGAAPSLTVAFPLDSERAGA